jgi:Fibronectin type III domain
MQLSRRTDSELETFVSNHLLQMDNNPNFPDQQPSPPVLSSLFTAYQDDLARLAAAWTALEVALTARDASRTALEVGMQVRGAYVQAVTNGNCNLIVNSGLNVRRDPTPTGPLAPPINIIIELGVTAGTMKLKWKPVKKARSYLIEYSPADTMERVWSPLKTTGRAKLGISDLTLGQSYAFRIAAVGGSTGQSNWSAEVIRMAA